LLSKGKKIHVLFLDGKESHVRGRGEEREKERKGFLQTSKERVPSRLSLDKKGDSLHECGLEKSRSEKEDDCHLQKRDGVNSGKARAEGKEPRSSLSSKRKKKSHLWCGEKRGRFVQRQEGASKGKGERRAGPPATFRRSAPLFCLTRFGWLYENIEGKREGNVKRPPRRYPLYAVALVQEKRRKDPSPSFIMERTRGHAGGKGGPGG